MTRPLRIEYPGALYHVMARGNAHQSIYLDDKDRLAFLENLKHCFELHNIVCHAYCLMDNHYHLLLETPDGNLSTAMRDINGNYTQRFNFRHKRVGHLLQGRYKAYVIEKELYLLEVARYIVNNPVKASLARSARNWKWSSYNATAGFRKFPEWLEVNFILRKFGKVRKESQKRYRDFVQENSEGKSPYVEIKEGIILGSPQFIDWIWRTQTTGSEELLEIPRSQRIVGRPTIEELFLGVDGPAERVAAVIIAKKRCGYLNSEIARFLGISNSTVGKIINGTYNLK